MAFCFWLLLPDCVLEWQGVHTYLKHVNATDPTSPVESQLPHIAAFMLAQTENWYYFGSTGWWDNDFVWNDLYDKGAAS